MRLKSLIALAIFGFAAAEAGVAAADPWKGESGDRRGYREDYRDRRVRDRDVWRGEDGRYYCRRENGTTGLLVGGAAGALLGRQVDGGRDRTLGTVLGAAGGALLGREIDRGDSRCR